MKEAKRRFLSEFFNQPFEVTKGCERSIGVLKFCFFSISQRNFLINYYYFFKILLLLLCIFPLKRMF
uniref:Uncharacterized protein n=1 Tax=Ascaris lumbricoides TaxID=6252 RepID=A0A0M3IWM8_ASCLU